MKYCSNCGKSVDSNVCTDSVEHKVSVFATEGPVKGIWAFFKTDEEAITFMSSHPTPFKVFSCK